MVVAAAEMPPATAEVAMAAVAAEMPTVMAAMLRQFFLAGIGVAGREIRPLRRWNVNMKKRQR